MIVPGVDDALCNDGISAIRADGGGGRTSDMLLLGSRLLWSSRFLDVLRELVLGFLLVDGPRRIVDGVAVDVVLVPSGTSRRLPAVCASARATRTVAGTYSDIGGARRVALPPLRMSCSLPPRLPVSFAAPLRSSLRRGAPHSRRRGVSSASAQFRAPARPTLSIVVLSAIPVITFVLGSS